MYLITDFLFGEFRKNGLEVCPVVSPKADLQGYCLDYKTPIVCHGDTIITVCTQFPHDSSKDQDQEKLKYQL